MSFIRPSSQPRYSQTEPGIYVFQGTDYIEDYGALRNPEALCETIFRILNQADVEFTVEEVDKVRNRLNLEPMNQISHENTLNPEFKQRLSENR